MEEFFKKDLIQRYESDAERSSEPATLAGMLQYMLDRGIINRITLRKYCVLALYPQALKDNSSRMDAIAEIEARTGYKQTAIYQTLKNQKLYKVRAKKKPS